MSADLKIKPLARGKQRDSFLLSAPGGARGHLWEGTTRSGKTLTSIVRWLRFVLDGPPGNLAMIGKTERTLKRNVIDTIEQMLGPKRCRVTMGKGEVVINGRVVYIAGANNAAAVSKIQGMTLVGWYGDEMPTWPEEVFDMATTRLSDVGAEWFGTGNPEALTHFLKTRIIDRCSLHLERDGSIRRRSGPDIQDVHVYSFSLYDNPFLPADFIEELKRAYTGMFRRRMIDGEWCMAEGAIYDSWDPERHVLRAGELPPMKRWTGIGVDHGTTNPFHAVSLGLGAAPWGAPGLVLYVTAEHRYDSARANRKKTDLEYSHDLLAWQRRQAASLRHDEPEYICIDPSATGFRQQLYALGQPSTLADNAVLDGIRTVASHIGNDKLFVSDACPELIKEIPSYAWDDDAARLGKDQPIKVMDHGCDGLRYIAHTSRSTYLDELYPDLLELSGAMY